MLPAAAGLRSACPSSPDPHLPPSTPLALPPPWLPALFASCLPNPPPRGGGTSACLPLLSNSFPGRASCCFPLFSPIYPGWLCFSMCPELPWQGLSSGHPCRGVWCCYPQPGVPQGTQRPPQRPQINLRTTRREGERHSKESLVGNPGCCTAPGLQVSLSHSLTAILHHSLAAQELQDPGSARGKAAAFPWHFNSGQLKPIPWCRLHQPWPPCSSLVPERSKEGLVSWSGKILH